MIWDKSTIIRLSLFAYKIKFVCLFDFKGIYVIKVLHKGIMLAKPVTQILSPNAKKSTDFFFNFQNVYELARETKRQREKAPSDGAPPPHNPFSFTSLSCQGLGHTHRYMHTHAYAHHTHTSCMCLSPWGWYLNCSQWCEIQLPWLLGYRAGPKGVYIWKTLLKSNLAMTSNRSVHNSNSAFSWLPTMKNTDHE